MVKPHKSVPDGSFSSSIWKDRLKAKLFGVLLTSLAAVPSRLFKSDKRCHSDLKVLSKLSVCVCLCVCVCVCVCDIILYLHRWQRVTNLYFIKTPSPLYCFFSIPLFQILSTPYRSFSCLVSLAECVITPNLLLFCLTLWT